MAYVLPQVQVFQDFRAVPVSSRRPLRALIIGPHAHLVRYNVLSEREKGFVGYYDHLTETTFAWPNRPATASKIDLPFTKVFIRDALLRYFHDDIGSGSVITKVTGYANRVRSATLSFRANGTYARSAVFKDRDVQPGDIVRVRAIVDGDPVVLWTYVQDIQGDVLPSVVGTLAYDSANPVNPPGSQTASSSVVKVGGPDNCVVVTSDHTDYEGLTSGFLTETYDILVTAGSVNGDYTKARLRVISGSGTDDQVNVVPAPRGQPTNIGTRGLKVIFDEIDTLACSQDATNAGVPADELVVGQRWRVTVQADFTPATAVSGGAYNGDEDTTYIIQVTRGGTWAQNPQISVSTTNGIDVSGPTTVAAATAVPVGSFGVTVTFTGAGLRKGDRYYISCTGRKQGPMRTLVLGHNLPAGVADGDEVGVTLFIRQPLLRVVKNRIGSAPQTNWNADNDGVTLKPGLLAFDPSWTDNGVPQALPVEAEPSRDYGRVYVEYRAWLPDASYGMESAVTVGELDAKLSGPLHPDNPLKWGVYNALTNANGTDVRFVSVADPDDANAWVRAIDTVVGRDDVYSIVPLTYRRDVLQAAFAHVQAMSSPEQGLWRVLWVALQSVPMAPIVHAGTDVPNHDQPTTTDGQVALATILDDPLATGTQHTILTVTSDNVNFLQQRIRPGDIVRAEFTGDGFGGVTYNEYVVAEVRSENQLRLVSGPVLPVTVPAKFEVWRKLTPAEEAEEIGRQAKVWGNRRVRAVWPDHFRRDGMVSEGYHLAAVLAGLSSGVLPHQNLTNVELSAGIDVRSGIERFGRTQLDRMAELGVWIVVADPVTGQVYNRHAVTTADTNDVNQREEMVTRNVDSISYRFKDAFKPFIGVMNVTPSTLERLRSAASIVLNDLITQSGSPLLGSQLVDGQIVELRQHETMRDHVVMVVNLLIPYALNVLTIRLVV